MSRSLHPMAVPVLVLLAVLAGAACDGGMVPAPAPTPQPSPAPQPNPGAIDNLTPGRRTKETVHIRDTATGGQKPAKLETGATVRVPLFINEGEVIKVDTRSGTYISRVKQ